MNYIKFIRIFLLVLIIIGVGLLVTQKMWVPKAVEMILSNENKYQPVSLISDNKNKQQSYQSNTANVKFEIPRGWAVDNATSTLHIPSGYKDPDFVLQKVGTTCVIVAAKNNDSVPWENNQISFADRIYSNYIQFDGDWWLAPSSESAKSSFSDHTRQYIPGEFRISSSPRNDHFILFMSDRASVPNDCNSDFNALLKTVEPYYETVHLTPNSKGILNTEKVWDDVTPPAANKTYEHLVFIADGSNEKRELMRLPTGTWASRFSVSGGKLYVPSNSARFVEAEKNYHINSALYSLDPFTTQTVQIPGSTGSDRYISSLYLRDGNAYYLASSSALGGCLDGYHLCAADLYSIPLTGGTPTLVAHSSVGGGIVGYVDSENAFYIEQGWGDAGCSSVSIIKIIGTNEEPVGKYSGCYEGGATDDAAFKQKIKAIDTITAKARASRLSARVVRVENGILQPALTNADVSADATFYFDR